MKELKTLIDVSAGTRLLQYEPEIFSDLVLTGYYLRKLCEQYDWYDHGDSVPCIAYFYAKYVMETRWPEAEHVIATHPEYAYYYVRDVMKCRWPEAEHIVATDPQWAMWYARFVMKCRWPEAEHVIATDGVYRKWYNDKFGTSLCMN